MFQIPERYGIVIIQLSDPLTLTPYMHYTYFFDYNGKGGAGGWRHPYPMVVFR
jgi:hypothetical protein